MLVQLDIGKVRLKQFPFEFDFLAVAALDSHAVLPARQTKAHRCSGQIQDLHDQHHQLETIIAHLAA